MTSASQADESLPRRGPPPGRLRRFGFYLVLVALPATLALAGARWIRDAEARRLARVESTRVARTALELVAPVREDGGTNRLEPEALVTLLEASLGYEAAVFSGAERIAGSDPGFGSDSTLIPYLELAEPGAAVDLPLAGRPAALASGTAHASGDLRSVLVSRSSPRLNRPGILDRWWLPPTFLLFTLLLGWLLLPGPPTSNLRARTRCWAAALAPALIVMAVLFTLDRELTRAGREARIRQLTLASVVVREAARNAPMEEIRRIGGFPAARLSPDGAVVSASGDAPAEGLEDVPRPPSTRTIAGELEGPDRTWLWVALRDRAAGRGTLVLTRPADPHGYPPGRLRLLVLALAVLAAALGFPELWRKGGGRVGPGSADLHA